MQQPCTQMCLHFQKEDKLSFRAGSEFQKDLAKHLRRPDDKWGRLPNVGTAGPGTTPPVEAGDATGVLVCLPCLVQCCLGQLLPPLLRPRSQGWLKLLSLAGGSGVFWVVDPLGPQGRTLGGQHCLCENRDFGDFFPQSSICLSLSLS